MNNLLKKTLPKVRFGTGKTFWIHLKKETAMEMPCLFKNIHLEE